MVDNVYMMAFGYSLALVSAGSALHALWNVLVKRSGTSDVAFVWVYSAITAPLWLVVLTVGAIWGGLGPAWWAALVSTALHTAYAAVLQRAYSAADLSVVYPVSRGLAPVLVTAVVAPWTGGPSAIQTLALMAVLVGVVLASRVTWRNLTRARGLWAGGAVASCTAAYTLWDAFAVAEPVRRSVAGRRPPARARSRGLTGPRPGACGRPGSGEPGDDGRLLGQVSGRGQGGSGKGGGGRAVGHGGAQALGLVAAVDVGQDVAGH